MRTSICFGFVWLFFTAPAYSELIAYDPFHSPDIGTSLFRQESGDGFVGTWKSWGGAPNQTNWRVVDGSLNYPGLPTSGNSVHSPVLSGEWVGIVHELDQRPDELTTKYLSFLMQPDQVGDGSFGVMLDGSRGGGDIAIGKSPSSGGRYMIETFFDLATQTSNVRVEAGVTTFMVVKAELGIGPDTFTLFVNPTIGEPEPTSRVIKRDLDIGQITGIGLGAGGGLRVDEIRWGDTFEDVTPMIMSSVAGDFDGDRMLTTEDINLLTSAVNMFDPSDLFDLNEDGLVGETDHGMWVRDLRNTWFGDANLDDEFNSGDFVEVFKAGKYEVDAEAGWQEGDWNADQRFDSGDFVKAFKDGGYERGPRAEAVNAVPEPSGVFLIVLAGFVLFAGLRR